VKAVKQIIIYLFMMSVQIRDVPDDEAVRIFLEFERLESAIKGIFLPPYYARPNWLAEA